MAANTRDIRRRIKSVKNTAQITKAMQMVAASKMRKAQTAALAGRPYATLLNRVLVSLGASAAIGEGYAHPLLETREGGRDGITRAVGLVEREPEIRRDREPVDRVARLAEPLEADPPVVTT